MLSVQVLEIKSACLFSPGYSKSWAEAINNFAGFEEYLSFRFLVMYSTSEFSSILQTKQGVCYVEHFQMAVYRPVCGDRLADHRLYSGVFQAL